MPARDRLSTVPTPPGFAARGVLRAWAMAGVLVWLRGLATVRRVTRTGAVVRGFVARVKSGVNGLRKQTRGARPLIHT